MQTERKWLPANWLDEAVPTLGDRPEDFLRRNGDGVLQLAPIEGADSGWSSTDVADGQILCFCWYEHRGHRTLTMLADGTWSLDEPFADDTNCLRAGDDDGEDIWNELSDLVAAKRERGEIGSYPYVVDIEGWTWSDGEYFRVRVLESGGVELVEVPRLGEDGAEQLILRERTRQIEVEGWTAVHDDQHDAGELLQAAKAYLNWYQGRTHETRENGTPLEFPETWGALWWKPKSRRRNLVRAGALALAEVERLERRPSVDRAAVAAACKVKADAILLLSSRCSEEAGDAD